MTRTRVRSLSRPQVVSALIGVRALTLGVPRRDLEQAIALTDRDRLETLCAVSGAVACSWQTGGAW